MVQLVLQKFSQQLPKNEESKVLGRVQLISKLNSNLSGAEITSNFSTYK